ncbi:cupin [Nonomuraea sp. NPDC049419]|uniref:cupin n=1 Tax=Nonomuraea sp. NPDC049419 TaxID=3155772 RepID=UPI0034391F43
MTPFDLLMSIVRLSASGEIHAGRGGVDRDGWRLHVLHAKTATDVHGGHWALHPEADELVSCIVGKIRLYLRGEGRGEEEVKLCAGTAAIVPRGRCHRIALDIPSTILTATLRPADRPDRPA